MQIRIPTDPDFISNLVLQRTAPFLKLGGKNALNDWFDAGSSEGLFKFLNDNKLVDEFLHLAFEEILTEIKSFRKILPQNCLDTIVSIGPGNGIIEFILASEGYTSNIVLIDIERTDYHYHGFNNKGAGYANLQATKSFILENTSQNIEVHTCNPSRDELPSVEYSLLISFFSMGFHFPCDDYVHFIKNQGKPNSIVAIDKRRGTDDNGFNEILKSFSPIGRVTGSKSDRWILSAN